VLQFPQNFFWGAATSSYQVEGNNVNSDWWEWEKKLGLKETSGPACRHYELYKEDFDLARALNHNCHRLSVEWSRIEPREGEFSPDELGHYKDVMRSLKERGIEPIVTLHHFSNPIWFAEKGGWSNKDAPGYFLRFAQKTVDTLSDNVRFWVTINEPLVYAYHAYLLGAWPPQEKSLLKAQKVANNFISAHVKAYNLIHAIYKQKALPSPCVSIAKNLQEFIPCVNTFRNRFAATLRDRTFNYAFLNKLIRHKALDFIGVNYYTRSLVETKGSSLRSLLLDVCKNNHSQLKKNSLGWDIYPKGLLHLLLKLKKYHLPVFILENGICTEDDTLRRQFIYEHLKHIHLAIENGVRVMGYVYWSLLDNYEWDKGYSPRFGLIQVDCATYKRTIRPSAIDFSQICKSGRLINGTD
jgi:beta-glucosidase